VTIWLEPAIAAAGIVLLLVLGRWPTAGVTAFTSVACFAAAGSLRAAAYAIRRAADMEGFDEPDPSSLASATRSLTKKLGTASAKIERIPERMALVLHLALYFAGAATAVLAFDEHAAAAGWAAAAAGLTGARLVTRDRPRLRALVFMVSAMPGGLLSLLVFWLLGKDFGVPFGGEALVVMASAGCATGAAVVVMRWRMSEHLSLPPAVAFTVWSLTYYYGTSMGKLGYEPFVVGWGVGLGATVAAAGYLLGVLGSAAAGAVLFLVGRIYAFVNWYGALPYVLASVLGWRPRLWRKKTAEGPTARGAAYEVVTGVLPFALAGGFFLFQSAIFFAAYSAACAATAVVTLAPMLERHPRARIVAPALLGAILPIIPVFFLTIEGDTYGLWQVATAIAGVSVAWIAGGALRKHSSEWMEMAAPIRRAALGALAAAVAVSLAALAKAVQSS